MKPWIKRTLFGLVGATVVLGSLTACGHRSHYGAMSAEEQAQFKARMVERVGSKLDLNADQKTRLTTLADTLQAQRKAMMGNTTDPRADLLALVATDKFDKARAQALVTEKTTALQTASPQVLAALADFYDSLNPAQQAKVRDFMQRRHGWHRG